ncbi:hypothetical protein ARMSODRAFT_1023547 [Armillaria solidipes]|uniref:Uncharacterized protein n=1 Tax=Armillaria solidipes TaxID=1076256 RepID=A0A2H3AZ13_9AGAR|nr:hypothetical protein ARMSODRAFT_1023547 [Armillaria solidipes]
MVIGGAFTLAVASTGTLSADVQIRRLRSYIRSLTVYESAPIVLGFPIPAQNWTPLMSNLSQRVSGFKPSIGNLTAEHGK